MQRVNLHRGKREEKKKGESKEKARTQKVPVASELSGEGHRIDNPALFERRSLENPGNRERRVNSSINTRAGI